MLLTITTTATEVAGERVPATDLGYLLHKHPDRVQAFPQSFGTLTVLYPEAGEERCTAALLLEVDAVRLARRRRGGPDVTLGHYVNDRAYAASSLLGVAVADVLSTARSGVCRSRQALADSAIPLELRLPALPCRGGLDVARRLFEPLGWTVAATPVPLDPDFAEWGESRYLDLTLTGTVRLADALNQLHVLLPVLDESKHYWQGPDEVDKLLRSGGDWLTGHPERELVVRRYLGRRGALIRLALARLAELDGEADESLDDDAAAAADETAALPAERRAPLNTQRREAVLAALAELGAASVIDLGCGGGQLLKALLDDGRYRRVTGVDVSARALQLAARAVRLERMSERQAERLSLFQGALTYDDERFAGYDAAVLMEVVEHLDPPRLPALERVVFGVAAPAAVIVTTPNVEYNALYEGLAERPGAHRHHDHRFEWTRAEFAAWCERVGAAHGYAVELRGVGEADDELGAPTQLAVFRRG
ncbi:3' terminal RNA ribose 2'-O-methyltransferase Hen1 [Nocardioides marinquilinus]|uniref:3' terminal RNA ribose 2'-O-methyltransferase Hen1 n=1 Tax=Nocardioides marinquilinus TaxID=1210400 RepID=UPI0031E89E74